ncbi:alpha/beta hydrolase [Pikeienuella sp. HZG-20]|uniref:alpha/beta fold hydrolase n=1 Tax=Paludibacillus litoralis TaxID=3133267 RepID=UPI0030EF89CA
MINYVRRGQGPTLVLVHGFLGGSCLWRPAIAHFARFFDTIAVDLPGFGASAAAPAPGAPRDFSAAVFEQLDALGVERFHLVGSSIGGFIVQEMALAQPDRVERLVIYGSSAFIDTAARFETVEESVARFRRDGLAATATRIAETWFVEGADTPYFHLCREALTNVEVEKAAATLAACSDWDIRARLAEITMPTLVIAGERDRSFSLEQFVGLRRGLPDAQLAILPDCAHIAHLERPALFNQVVTEFLLGSPRRAE